MNAAATKDGAMAAIVCVRDGALPAGGAEAVAEAGGVVLLVGSGTGAALDELGRHRGLVADATLVETTGPFALTAASLAAWVAAHDVAVVILPASPDGRDLAPVVAHRLGRPLLDGAVAVRAGGATCLRWGGLVLDSFDVSVPFVATLQPGVRGLPAADPSAAPPAVRHAAPVTDAATPAAASATVLAVLPPDVTTMDLAEAPRVVGGGAGLDGAERFHQLASVARAIGAAMGGTRVITDRGWIDHARQIGTTGVTVDPDLYLAFGISGAVQHTAGLGDPRHVVSVNLDRHCPMMQRADLAIVADANAVLDALAARLEPSARPVAAER